MGQFCSKDNAFQAEASTMQQPTQAVHEMLAKLETLKKQIDSGSVEDLPAIERELDQAGVTVQPWSSQRGRGFGARQNVEHELLVFRRFDRGSNGDDDKERAVVYKNMTFKKNTCSKYNK